MNLLSALRSAHLFHKKESLTTLSTEWGDSLNPDQVLKDYPRPQMVRDSYINLNGFWNYKLYKKNPRTLLKEGSILVPFSPEAPLSGADFSLGPDELLEYIYPISDLTLKEGERCLLHFGAVDQYARIYIDDQLIGSHTGGYLPFSFDITPFLKESESVLRVYVEDHSDLSYHSVGKQRIHRGGMFYTAQSGIWQTVWMEVVPSIYMEDVSITPHIDKETIEVSLHLNQPIPYHPSDELVSCYVFDQEGMQISKGIFTNHAHSLCEYHCYCDIGDPHLWSPDDPYLYTIRIVAGTDQVESYFAMREFSIEYDEKELPRFCLNHKPIFLNGILDQGYWPDGLYTAPSDEALIYDIKTAKELGFCMIRKHAKIEPARWYYHCDRLGMIVWQDMVNGGSYHAPVMTWLPTVLPALKTHMPDRIYPLLGRKNPHGRAEFVKECQDTIQALRAFPCISTWVLFNEGWGQFDSKQLTDLLHELDPTRTVDSASGWFDLGYGDYKSEHNYFSKQSIKPDKRAFVISEYGGYSYKIPEHHTSKAVYGYKIFRSQAAYHSAFTDLMEQEIQPLIEQGLCGAVYTQLSDIEDEVNGIMTYDRKVKKL